MGVRARVRGKLKMDVFGLIACRVSFNFQMTLRVVANHHSQGSISRRSTSLVGPRLITV